MVEIKNRTFDAWALLLAAKTAHNIICELRIGLGHKHVRGWGYAQEDQRRARSNYVKAIVDNPDMTPLMLHEQWRDRKMTEGWKYGEEYSIEKKTHPWLRSYAKLSAEQKAEGYLFGVTVRTILGMKLPGWRPM